MANRLVKIIVYIAVVTCAMVFIYNFAEADTIGGTPKWEWITGNYIQPIKYAGSYSTPSSTAYCLGGDCIVSWPDTNNLFDQWLDTTNTPTFVGINASTTNADYLTANYATTTYSSHASEFCLTNDCISTWPLGVNDWQVLNGYLTPSTTIDVRLPQYAAIGTTTANSVLTLMKPYAFDYVGLAYLSATTTNTVEAGTTLGTAFIVGPHSTNVEYTWIGKNTTFDRIYFDLAAGGSTVTYVWQYSKGAGVWDTLTVTDGTTNLTVDGSVTFTPPALWATDTINGYTGYLVRVRPTTDPATHPTAFVVVPSATEVLHVYANPNDTVSSLRVTKQGNVSIANETTETYKFYVAGTTNFAGASLVGGTLGQTQTQAVARTAGISTYSGTAAAVNAQQYSPAFWQYGAGWESSNLTDVNLINSFGVATYEATPVDVAFSSDGAKMYVLGDTGNDITYYNLGTPWDVTSAVYVSQFQVGTPTTETNPSGFYFRNDGLMFWVVGSLTDKVYQFSMSSAWNMATAAYDTVSFSVTAEETLPSSVFFKPDGKVMYVTGSTGDDVNQYQLGTAWNVTTAVYKKIFSIAGQETGSAGMYFSSDGYRMYIYGTTGDDVNIYRLSTPWDVGSAAYRTIYTIAAETTPGGLYLRTDGVKLYTIGSGLDTVREYTLAVPNEINTTAVSTIANYYSQVIPTQGNPITARRGDGFRYGVSEYNDFWNYLSNGNVGFGTTTPLYKLSVISYRNDEDLLQIGTSTENNVFVIDRKGNATSTGRLAVLGGNSDQWNAAFSSIWTTALDDTNWDSNFNSTSTWWAFGTNFDNYILASTTINTSNNLSEYNNDAGFVTSSGVTTFVATTTATYDGNIGGYVAANTECNSAYPDSHICTDGEIMSYIANGGDITGWGSDSSTGWYAEVAPGYLANANDCAGFTSNSATYLGAFYVFNATDGGYGALVNCSNLKPLICCE